MCDNDGKWSRSETKRENKALLHKEDCVAGERGPFADAPCFRPIVPRMTSCRGEESQPIEYLPLESQASVENKQPPKNVPLNHVFVLVNKTIKCLRNSQLLSIDQAHSVAKNFD